MLFLIISKDVQFHLKKNKIDFYVFPIFPKYYVISIFCLKFNFIELSEFFSAKDEERISEESNILFFEQSEYFSGIAKERISEKSNILFFEQSEYFSGIAKERIFEEFVTRRR